MHPLATILLSHGTCPPASPASQCSTSLSCNMARLVLPTFVFSLLSGGKSLESSWMTSEQSHCWFTVSTRLLPFLHASYMFAESRRLALSHYLTGLARATNTKTKLCGVQVHEAAGTTAVDNAHFWYQVVPGLGSRPLCGARLSRLGGREHAHSQSLSERVSRVGRGVVLAAASQVLSPALLPSPVPVGTGALSDSSSVRFAAFCLGSGVPLGAPVLPEPQAPPFHLLCEDECMVLFACVFQFSS